MPSFMEKLLSAGRSARRKAGDTFASLGPRGNSIILETRILRPCRLPGLNWMQPGKGRFMKFDHMTLPVSDCTASRDWYVKHLGFKLEFENLAAGFSAIQDDNDFPIF